MTAWRSALAVAFASGLLGFGITFVDTHNPGVLEAAFFCGLGLICALFERGRYRARLVSAANLRPTGETFFDPVSGKRTDVLYDPVTGAREYRT